jgi:hypothetical protein
MKKFTMSLFALFLSVGLLAQYYYIPYENVGTNPGGLNQDAEYPVGGGLPSGWATLLSGEQTTPIFTAAQTIPFTFKFNGTDVTSYKVSSSGVLTFTTAATTAPPEANGVLPSTDIPDMSVCVWGIKMVANDNIISKTFGTAPNRQHWVQFNSCSESGLQSGWTYWSIVLEETTNKIYIVDQRSYCYDGSAACSGTTSLTLGVQIDQTTFRMVSGSPNVESLTSNLPTAEDNTYYEFVNGTQPQYDMGVTELSMTKYLKLDDAPFTIKGTIRNFGTEPITSYDLNYSINGGATVTQTINTSPIVIFKSKTFSHPTGWTPTVAGTYEITAWATNINGSNADANTSNDEGKYTVEVVDNYVERNVLHEVFTASTCPPCNPGNAQIDGVLEQIPGLYTVVKYQWYFPGTGDPYFTDEVYARTQYYSINSVPRLELDGQWNSNPYGGYTKAVFDEYNTPSFLDISANYWSKGQFNNVTIEIDPLQNFSGAHKLHVAIVEKRTTQNMKTNGEIEFFYVMKKMLPNAEGTVLQPLVKGQKQTFELGWEFKGQYRLPTAARLSSSSAPIGANYAGIDNATEHSVENFDNLEIVVWVQNVASKVVLQSVFASDNIGIESEESESTFSLYPNPASDFTNIEFILEQNENVSISVYDMMGKVVYNNDLGNTINGYHTQQMDFSGFQSGMYILNLTIGDNTYTKKFIKE